MSNLIILIDQLARLAVAPLLLGLIATAALLLIVHNWRITLPALIVQYVLVGILLARAIPPGVAIIKPFAGAIVCLAISLAAQRADNARAARGESVAAKRVERSRHWSSLPAQFLVRVIAAVLMLTAAFGAAVRFPLPGDARELSLAAYTLVGGAVILIASTPEALNVGTGILMLLSGVEIGYMPLEPSITVSVLLGLMTLIVGIAVAYLVLADEGALSNSDDAPQQEATPGVAVARFVEEGA
ncbi:MAG: hypothetical protein NTZ50_05190 [Chloroflexi bacterium]|nr:hypothetical protein [Chloroflexota bacterium]